MATSYLGIQNGRRIELLAATTGGSTDANKMLALDANGFVPVGAIPPSIGQDTDSVLASESIGAGAWVNIYNNAGVAAVRNAVASGIGFECIGYVKAATASGVAATVYFDDNNVGTGFTVGRQYLSATTPGASTTTPPTGAGVISQYLGFAISSTIVHAAIEPATILAQ